MEMITIQEKKREIFTQIIVVQTLMRLGKTSGEITYSKAVKENGKWFVEEVQKGNIKPSRVGEGETPTKWYSVCDILARRLVEYKKMETILNQ